ncbi:MAG TPA: hypothetical protein VI932_03745 [Bacteroidota bacterium]|nr:hypothetical protein [Bacteroidota bacterium]
MARPGKVNLKNIRTISIHNRKSTVGVGAFGKPFDPSVGSFPAFIASLPKILAADELRRFAADVLKSRRAGKPVIAMIGAHVVKVGLSPVLIDLIDRKVLTCVAMNSAAAIHDAEAALWGVTSEDVAASLADGSFGMSRETGEFINGTLNRAYRKGGAGYGEALGRALLKAPHTRLSILAACVREGIPATVHAAIGTDIVHQQPTMNGAATGELSFRDFRILCSQVGELRGGGVVMNIGSAVVLPEVFLKALTVARNLGARARGFTTANFDMIQHYRPRLNVVARPASGGGRGYLFTGHHEIMIPLLAAMIKLGVPAR